MVAKEFEMERKRKFQLYKIRWRSVSVIVAFIGSFVSYSGSLTMTAKFVWARPSYLHCDENTSAREIGACV